MTLLSATLDSCSSFTPSKESAARTPDRLNASQHLHCFEYFCPDIQTLCLSSRESQIDIYVESLFHTGAWAECLKWAATSEESPGSLTLGSPGTIENVKVCKIIFEFCFLEIYRARSPTKLEWDTIDSYLSIFNSCLEQVGNQ